MMYPTSLFLSHRARTSRAVEAGVLLMGLRSSIGTVVLHALRVVAALGCACSDEEPRSKASGVPDAGTDAGRDAALADAGADREAPDAGDAEAGPAGPTRGNCGDTAACARASGGDRPRGKPAD